ncbi:MAG TPA: phosphatase PAP2 family protein [Hyphomicrobiaceae bacterium]|jgi:lipid A 4'-phosphatase|nr:phosphatase PAP2 family protein [Hyphomicrobiaceae bacterium]
MPTRPTWAAWVGTRTTWVLWGLPVAGGVVAAVVFLARPEIDLGVARLFHAPETGFVGQRLGWVRALRQGFVALYVGTIALCIAGLGLMWGGRRQWLGLGKTQWLYLAACLAAGPGLIANLVLKDNWGRARPSQITEFGGAKAFSPPLVPVNQCPRNCSFVSGEASSTYVTFYAAAALVPQWSIALAALGTAGGLATGLVRMAQGGHFLSDVVFAGVFMALTVLALRALMLRGGVRSPTPRQGAPDPPP